MRQQRRWWSLVVLAGVVTLASGCAPEDDASPAVAQTLRELAMENARTCAEIYTYPQALIDGLSHQLIEELRCMDPGWLAYYEPCKEVGCIWAHGPQPYAARPEVLDALYAAAASKNDYITITAGYRDVAMQYFSRWFRENCNANFHAAIPGQSNHQGGRAIDVRSYDYWRETLFDFGFEHPIPGDRPHYELIGDATFRAESLQLRELSVLAFQTLWNRNNPDDLLDEDATYGTLTKAALGASPVAGFPIWGCEAAPDPCDADPCADGCDPSLCAPDCGADPCADGCDPSLCEPACDADPCAEGCDISLCDGPPDPCEANPCVDGCPAWLCDDHCDANPCALGCEVAACDAYCTADPCAAGCDPSFCPPDCEATPCHPGCPFALCELFCEASPCDEVCPQDGCVPSEPDPCFDESCEPDPSEPVPGGGGGLVPDALTGSGSGCAAGGALAAWPWALLLAAWLSRGGRQIRRRAR